MPVSYIVVRNTSHEFEGAKSVPVMGKGKGKRITGTFIVTATCRILPMQLIYAGKTTRSHSQSIMFLQGFDVCHSDNHQSNEELATSYVHEIILPYVGKIKGELGIAEEQKNLLIYDLFKGQNTQSYSDLLLGKKYCSCMCSSKFDPQVSTYRH